MNVKWCALPGSPDAGEPVPLRHAVFPLGHQGAEVAFPGAVNLKSHGLRALVLRGTLWVVLTYLIPSFKAENMTMKVLKCSH